MSNSKNNIILVRAYELAEELASDPAGRDDRLFELIEANDLDNLLAFVQKVEAEIAQEYFHGFGILEPNDPY